jgi:hypothetical protein
MDGGSFMAVIILPCCGMPRPAWHRPTMPLMLSNTFTSESDGTLRSFSTRRHFGARWRVSFGALPSIIGAVFAGAQFSWKNSLIGAKAKTQARRLSANRGPETPEVPSSAKRWNNFRPKMPTCSGSNITEGGRWMKSRRKPVPRPKLSKIASLDCGSGCARSS